MNGEHSKTEVRPSKDVALSLREMADKLPKQPVHLGLLQQALRGGAAEIEQLRAQLDRAKRTAIHLERALRSNADETTDKPIGAQRFSMYVDDFDGVLKKHVVKHNADDKGAWVQSEDYEALRRRFERACQRVTELEGSAVEPSPVIADPTRWPMPPPPKTWMPAWLREFHCQCETSGDAAGKCVACQAADLIEKSPSNGTTEQT